MPLISVGDAMAQAIARVDELRAASPRRVRVRLTTHFGDLEPGLIISARIASKSNPELEAQNDLGVRHVAFNELDARAGELVGLVKEAAAEIEAAVANAPPPGPRSSAELKDMHVTALYEDTIAATYEAITGAVTPVKAQSEAELSPGVVREALVVGASRFIGMAVVTGRMESNYATEILQEEIRHQRRLLADVVPTDAQVH
ncbi:hypothetical protein [Phenylobacterium sp.]|uniref:hypothetical protein n=1 Tax=Phenylobacterium sp. TaxID=1871053 RepID=UPI00374DDBB9